MKIMACIGAVLFISACSLGTQPDERAFAQLAVGYILDDVTLSGEKVVVFESANLKTLPSEVRAELVSRLNAADVDWTELDVEGDVMQLPGQWEEIDSHGPLSRVNQTHILLRIEVSHQDGERDIQWSRRCGPLCGGGGEAVFRWNGQKWSHRQKSVISY